MVSTQVSLYRTDCAAAAVGFARIPLYGDNCSPPAVGGGAGSGPTTSQHHREWSSEGWPPLGSLPSLDNALAALPTPPGGGVNERPAAFGSNGGEPSSGAGVREEDQEGSGDDEEVEVRGRGRGPMLFSTASPRMETSDALLKSIDEKLGTLISLMAQAKGTAGP